MNTQPQSPANGRTLLVVFGITLMVTMGISSLIPVLPLLARAFAVPEELAGLTIAAFALPGLLCIPIAGVLSDRYGRKAVLIPALVLFSLGGFACIFTTSFAELLSCRVIQGIGAAPLGILYNTIIADTWKDGDRVRIMSYNAMVLGLGSAVSPAVSGALSVFLGWPAPFFLSLLGLPVLGLVLTVPFMRPERAASITGYLRAVFVCLRAPKTLNVLMLGFGTSMLLFGPVVTCFPLLAHTVFFADAFDIGIIMAISSLGSGLAAWRLAPLFSRFDAKRMLYAGCAFYGLAFCLMPFMQGLWWLILPLVCFGFAQGLCIPLSSFLLTGQAPPEQRAALVAVSAMLLRLAQTIAPIFFSGLAVHAGLTASILTAVLVALLMVLPASNIAKAD